MEDKLVIVSTVGAVRECQVTQNHQVTVKYFFLFLRSEGNRGYLLKLGSSVLPVYCHMTNDLGACGGGGWTLVMKIDGNQVTLKGTSCHRSSFLRI